MFSNFVISIIFLITLTTLCCCDQHIYGTENAGDKLLFEKVLFSHNGVKPKNYTIVFKYIASELSPNITFAKFEVHNTTSHGLFDVNAEKGKEKSLQAQFNVVNGTNVYVVGKIYGSSVNLYDADALQKATFANSAQNNPKTVTVVYGHNTTKTRNRKVILGHRQPDDKLINFQSQNVTFSYRFAESEMEYYNKDHYITSVDFSFDSPTAIAFVNSTFVREHGVTVVAYDLNSPFFVANMSVYGYDRFMKPETYKPIVIRYSKNGAILQYSK